MKQFFKMCSVFRRPEGFFLFGVLNTLYGGVTVPPASRLPLTATASELGATVEKIFKGLPNQVAKADLASSGKIYDAYMSEIGFRKPSIFEKKATLVGVHFDGSFYEVVPHQKDERGAFVAMAPITHTHTSSLESIGKSILSAFEEINGTPA